MADVAWLKGFQFFDSDGDPLNAGTIRIYDANTTDERTVYQDADEQTAWSQPITLDSAGRLTHSIYVPTGDWKFDLADSGGSTIATEDDIPGATATASTTYARPQRPVLAKAANYTVTTSDLGKFIAADATGGDFTLTLPSAIDAGDGKDIAVQAVGTGGKVTIATTGGQTVNGASSVALFRQYASMTVRSDGANWYATGSDLPVSTLSKSADYTATLADAGKLIKCDATSAGFTITLPAAASAGSGFDITIKKIDASTNAVTIDGNGSETIDGATTITLSAQYLWVRLRCDGSNWLIVARAPIASQVANTAAGNISATTVQAAINELDTEKEPAAAYSAINTQTDDYTLVLTDAGKLIEMNKGSSNTLTVPPNSSVAFPTKTRIDIVQYGAGQTTIAAGSGVTIRSRSSYLKLSGQYSGATLYKRATDEWVLIGDLTT